MPGDVRRPTALVNPDLRRPHIPLDFPRRQSVHAVVERRGEDPMSAGPESGISIIGCLCEIRDRLTDAAAVAKAAVTCAESGSEHRGGQDRARRRGDDPRGEHAPERGHAPQPHAAENAREPRARNRLAARQNRRQPIRSPPAMSP